MGLLDVEREDLVRDLALRHEQREHAPRPELLQRGQAMATVRRQVSVALPDRHDGIEVPLRLVHREREPADVRIRDVALEGRALDLLDGERAEEERVAAERLAVRREHRATVRLDRLRELVERGRALQDREVAGPELGRLELHPLAGAGAAALRHRALLLGHERIVTPARRAGVAPGRAAPQYQRP